MTTTGPTDGVRVNGAATAEEVAAVLAVLARAGREEPEETGYERWRATRRSVIRRGAIRAIPEPVERPT
jgi:hypothetical protein